ncbi:MAG: hypothetical protein ABSF98_27065 [Bryobacteraceae bacterium]|jgi:hypothetical protein
MTRDDFLRQEIDKYEKKVETYKAMIAEWRSELGISGESVANPQTTDVLAKKKNAGASDPLSLVQGMIFFNKSQTEAAKAFLEMVGYPLRTSVILEAIEKGGITVGGKTAATKKQNFYTGLHRSSDFGLAHKDTWGLTSWPNITKKASEEDQGEEQSKGNGDLKKATATESKPS